MFLNQSAVLKLYKCDPAHLLSRQHFDMQVSGWGLNIELTKDNCILNQMENDWGGGGEKTGTSSESGHIQILVS